MIRFKRTLVCGDRDWAFRDPLWAVLRYVAPEEIVHGDARGADRIAEDWAMADDDVKIWSFPADWGRFGRGAGPIRNRQMARVAKPTFVLAFHDHILKSKGTADMLCVAADANIPYALLTSRDCRRFS